MKNTYVKCADWSWEDKLLYIKACIGEDIPHNKICGHAVLSKDVLLSLYRDAHYIYCLDDWMIAYDGQTKSPDIGGKSEIKLRSLKPRTKTEFVKCEFNHAWEAVKAFEDGEELYTKRSHKDFVLIDNAPDVLRFLYDLHRKVETEIDERQEFIDTYASLRHEFHGQRTYDDFSGFMYDSGKFKLVDSND